MTQQLEAMKLALEALEEACEIVGAAWSWRDAKGKPSITALRQAIEQAQKQEPVATVSIEHFRGLKSMENVEFQLMADLPVGSHLLYTSPPQRQPLTDDEIWKDDGIMAANSAYGATFDTLREIVRAIEAAHGIKGEA